jgi:hypothetical protein
MLSMGMMASVFDLMEPSGLGPAYVSTFCVFGQ